MVNIIIKKEKIRIIKAIFVIFNIEQIIITYSYIIRQGNTFEPGVHDIDQMSSINNKIIIKTLLIIIAKNKILMTIHLYK